MTDPPGPGADPEPAPDPAPPEVRVVSSPRRRRTVSARMVDGVIEVRVPSWMPKGEREQWAERMRERVTRQTRRAPRDEDLERRGRGVNPRPLFRGPRWGPPGGAAPRPGG